MTSQTPTEPEAQTRPRLSPAREWLETYALLSTTSVPTDPRAWMSYWDDKESTRYNLRKISQWLQLHAATTR